jgi:hypothetical protein
MKQTAVEWFFNELQRMQYFIGNDMVEAYNQAKEMEKQQMFEYIKNNYCIGNKSLEFHRLEFEQYYNKTFKEIEKS